MYYKVSDKIMQEIVNYVTSKPFREVAQLVQLIQAELKPIEEETKQEA